LHSGLNAGLLRTIKQSVKTDRTLSKAFKAVSSLLLALLVVFLSVASASPIPHKLIHADAGSPTHVCAITLFAKGQVSSADVSPIVAVFAPPVVQSVRLEVSVAYPASDVQLASSRGPPAI
jgi:hypothetical protein